jgi:hypothetical protein
VETRRNYNATHDRCPRAARLAAFAAIYATYRQSAWKIENLGKLRTRDATRFAHQGALLEEGFAALIDS